MEQQINKKIVEFIRDNWVNKIENNSAFAVEHLIDEKTVREIRKNSNYKISLLTVIRICHSKKISLAKFFEQVGV